MRHLYRLLSLRTQSLLLLLVAVLCLGWLSFPAQTLNRFVVNQQSLNAEQWVHYLLQQQAHEQQEQILQQAPGSKVSGDFVYLGWFGPHQNPVALAGLPGLDDDLLADVLKQAYRQRTPLVQVYCSDTCYLLQAFNYQQADQAGKVLAVSRLAPLLSTLRQASGIQGFFIGDMATPENWRNEPLERHWALLSNPTQDSAAELSNSMAAAGWQAWRPWATLRMS